MLKIIAKKIVPNSIWQYLRSKNLESISKNFEKKIVEHSYGRSQLRVELTDPLSQSWYDHDWPSLSEMELMSKYKLKEGATVFDLGAHQSIVAMMISDYVGETGKVFAVEANDINYKTSLGNIERNNRTNVKVIKGAISNKEGTLSFNNNFNGAIDASSLKSSTIVECWSIDHMAKKYGEPHVVFLDIEGAEHMALEGAVETLKRPVDWFVEVHGKTAIENIGGSVEGVLSFFENGKHELFMKEADSSNDFIPFDRKAIDIDQRFFLIAISK